MYLEQFGRDDYKYRGVSRSDLRDGSAKKQIRSVRSSRKSDLGGIRDDPMDSSGVMQQLPGRRPRLNSGHSSLSQGHTLKRINKDKAPSNLFLPDISLPKVQ